MLKSLITIISLFTFLTFDSSQKSQPEIENLDCYLMPQIVSGATCFGTGAAAGISGHKYTAAVTSGGQTKPYDRTIELMITKSGVIVEAAYVTIPAGQTQSNNQLIFQNTSQRFGSVDITIANVNGSSSSACTWRSNSQYVMNCYHEDGDVSEGGEPGQDPDIPLEPTDPTDPDEPCIMDSNGNCI
jgi:hypothetical protein